MNERRLKAAVLISGSGSNLNALIQAVKTADLPLHIVRVISNRADAGGLAHAQAAHIPVSVIPHQDYANRDQHDAAISNILEEAQAELIVLAGYMRILSEAFAQRYSHCMINLHPSLLPRYKGLNTYNRALDAGDKETGASIHMVTAGLDDGPVISQVRIPITPGDDAASLAARLGPLEHQLLVATVRQFCEQTLRYEMTADENDESRNDESRNGRLVFKGKTLESPLQLQSDGSLI